MTAIYNATENRIYLDDVPYPIEVVKAIRILTAEELDTLDAAIFEYLASQKSNNQCK